MLLTDSKELTKQEATRSFFESELGVLLNVVQREENVDTFLHREPFEVFKKFILDPENISNHDDTRLVIHQFDQCLLRLYLVKIN